MGLVGDGAQTAAIQRGLDAGRPGAFDARRYDSEPQARVLVAAAVRPRILVAGVLGAVPTQVVADALRDAVARPVRVDDVRALPAGDGRRLSALFAVVGTLIPSLVLR